MAAAPLASHFEVVDQHDRTVGNAKHRTASEARELLLVLASLPDAAPLTVAEVTERVVVRRKVVRLVAGVDA